jgi:hypothetical protein
MPKALRDARIGIVNPTTAGAVRDGRLIRFCQAKFHMIEIPLYGSRGPLR